MTFISGVIIIFPSLFSSHSLLNFIYSVLKYVQSIFLSHPKPREKSGALPTDFGDLWIKMLVPFL